MRKLTIAFITYNRAQELIRAVESCYPIDVDGTKIIIWDNHSNIENKRSIETYVNLSQREIKYYYSEKNLGVSGGRNAVWKLCDSEYVFFLDDDAVIGYKGFFQKLCCYMDERPAVGAAGINIDEPATNTKLNCEVSYTTETGNLLILSYVGAAHIIRKKAIPTDRLYPEKLMFGSEELYASLNLWANGFEVHQVDELQVLHMPSKINRSVGKERDTNFLVNQYIVKKLLFPWYLLPFAKLALHMRILKNSLDFAECKQMIRERYDCNERCELGFDCWVRLVKMFGILKLI